MGLKRVGSALGEHFVIASSACFSTCFSKLKMLQSSRWVAPYAIMCVEHSAPCYPPSSNTCLPQYKRERLFLIQTCLHGIHHQLHPRHLVVRVMSNPDQLCCVNGCPVFLV